MKAKPLKFLAGEGFVGCPVKDATHIAFHLPGPTGKLTLPVITSGTRAGTNAWTWNGDTEKPTLRPSVLTTNGEGRWKCHSWITDGQAIFLPDSTHEHAGKTIDLLDVEEAHA